MPTFNLIDEPWIPCQIGATLHDLSLRQVFRTAEKIDEVVDTSPLTTIAMYRLLLSILHRAVGPSRDSNWLALWKDQGWDPDQVDVYLNTWTDRFDLLHPDRPFYQTNQIEKEPEPIHLLTHELGLTNAGMFSHARGDPLTPGQAARYVLAYHLFAPGGMTGLPAGEPTENKFTSAAPLAQSAVSLIKGDNLAQTLLLNLVRYDRAGKEAFWEAGPDLPAWEQEQPALPIERRPAGYLDWLTWQSRRVRLFPEEREGRLVITGALKMKGYQLSPAAPIKDYERMVAYRKIKEAKGNQSPWPPIGFRRGRAVWRDSLALFQPVLSGGSNQAPGTAVEMGDRIYNFHLNIPVLPLDLYGVSFDQYNVLFWKHERLPLAPRYLKDEALYARLQDALGLAEASGSALRRAVRRMAECLLAPRSDAGGGRQPDPKAVANLVTSMDPGGRYWSRLGGHFSRFLVDQAQASENDPQPTPMVEWNRSVRTAARQTFDEIANSRDADGWSLKAAVEAEQALLVGLYSAQKQHAPETLPKEVTREHATR